MKAGVITIGDELVQGFTIDKNFFCLAEKLYNYGITVKRNISIGDNSSEIKRVLDEYILDEYSLIFITGGLGPTHDDITKLSLAEYFETDIKLDKEHFNRLEKKALKKGSNFTSLVKSQAEILKCSTKINNNFGTALGMHIKFSKSDIYVLPGVPFEMEKMFVNEVIPEIVKKFKLVKSSWITIRTTGIYESKLYNLLLHLIESYRGKYKISFLPHYYGVDIRIVAETRLYSKKINEFIDIVKKPISKYIYGYNKDTISSSLFNLLLNKDISLSIAESCTGGLISKMITDFPGSSKIFLGSMISYSNDFKNKLLKVDKNNIYKYSEVSEVVSKEMCRNIKELTNSDSAISATGISGPSGGSEEKKVGLVYITVNYKSKFKTKEFNLYPNRKIHREVSAYTAMNMLRLLIKKNR